MRRKIGKPCSVAHGRHGVKQNYFKTIIASQIDAGDYDRRREITEAFNHFPFDGNLE